MTEKFRARPDDTVFGCPDHESQKIIYVGILEAIKRGEISVARPDESVLRILKMKFYLRRAVAVHDSK